MCKFKKMFIDQRSIKNLCKDENCPAIGFLLLMLGFLVVMYCMPSKYQNTNHSESQVQPYEDKPPSYNDLFELSETLFD